jgi:hypothetical protein
MKKNTLFWITGIVLLAVLLLFVPSMLMFGRGDFMHDGYGMMGGYDVGPGSSMMDGYSGYGMMSGGMMGGGWMTFGWIIPVFILILIIGAGVWLGNSLTNRSINRSVASARICSNCNKPANADWKTCPHCSTAL